MKKFFTLRTNEKGFTLVELMIVVAIIGILAAIAIPQFARYRKSGYVATINSDCRNAYTASAAFLADNPTAATIDSNNLTNSGYTNSVGVSVTSPITITNGAYSVTTTGQASWGLNKSNATLASNSLWIPANI